MSDVNVVVVSGAMGKRDSRMVTFGENTTPREVTTFGVMSIDSYEGHEKKTLVRCVGWGEQIGREVKEIPEGGTVVVQGRLSNRKGKDDQWVTEVTISKITVVGASTLPF